MRHYLVLTLGALLRVDLATATLHSRIHLGDLVDHLGQLVRCGPTLDHRALIEFRWRAEFLAPVNLPATWWCST